MNALRRTLALLLLAGAAAGAGPAFADTRTVPGAQLVLTDTLSEEVMISTDPTLSGNVRVSMDGSLSCLSIVSGRTAVIGTSGCGGDTGRLRIDVSPDTPVTISSSSDENIHVADLRSPLVASLSGSGDLLAGRSGGLVLALRGSADATAGEVDGPTTVEISGSNDVRIKEVNGPFTIKQTSSGDLVVGEIDSEAVTIESSGSGDMLFGTGHVGLLHARVLGSGDLSVAAAIRDADVEAHGGGDVRLAPVSGSLTRNASGGSEITVGGSDMVNKVTREVARKIRTGSSGSGGRTSTSAHIIGHLLAAAFAGLVIYISWRIVRRAGGVGGVRGWFGAQPPAAPTNPGVLAVGEAMARLEQRLGRVEGYVTTREFDLNRKFREL